MNKFTVAGRRFTVFALVVQFAVTALPAPALAGMIGTDAAIAAQQREANRAKVEATLEREAVQEQMVAMGVDPQEAKARVALLSDAELARLAAGIDTLPAGAGVVEVVGIVFIVLLVLELLGVTNVFTAV